MTKGEVKAAVRNNLNEENVPFYTDTDIEESLIDAHYWTEVFSNSVEKTYNLTFQLDTPYYDIQTLIPDLFAVTGVYDIERTRFLNYKPRIDLQALCHDYEIWKGPPEYFFVHGQKYLFIAPQPFSFITGPHLKIFYRAYDDHIIDDHSTYRVPIQGEDCLEYYATADLLEQAQEWSKAQLYWARFNKQLKDSKIAIRDRPMPALLNAFASIKY